MDLRKYLAEFIGTFLLTLAVSISLLVGTPLATPIVAAIALGLGVYTLGPISGGHFNPAVSIGLASINKLSRKDATYYVIAQVLGAGIAMLVARVIGGEFLSVGGSESPMVWVVEALGAAVLVFGVCSVVHKKVDSSASGLVIGGSLLLGLFLTAGRSNGVLNPAVSVGINSTSFAYLLAPIVGGIAAAWLYRYISR